MKKKQIVVGFSAFDFFRKDLDKLSDREKHEYFLNSETSISYDSPNDFFNELNDGFVDTENYFWYLIEID